MSNAGHTIHMYVLEPWMARVFCICLLLCIIYSINELSVKFVLLEIQLDHNETIVRLASVGYIALIGSSEDSLHQTVTQTTPCVRRPDKAGVGLAETRVQGDTKLRLVQE